MKRPRRSTLIIAGQFILLAVCLVFLGMLAWQNFFLRMLARNYIEEAGASEARFNYVRGHNWLYEMKVYKFDADDSGTVPDDGSVKPTGKTNGPFQVYSLLVNKDYPAVHQEFQHIFVDAYNRQMNLYYQHPEWFDKSGLRIPMHELQSNTNTPQAAN